MDSYEYISTRLLQTSANWFNAITRHIPPDQLSNPILIT